MKTPIKIIAVFFIYWPARFLLVSKQVTNIKLPSSEIRQTLISVMMNPN